MDYSDEREPFNHHTCAYQVDTLNCDEHLCSVNEWSCGEGQCIEEIHRYEWPEHTVMTKLSCHSMREYMFMCELSDRYQLWTSDDGTCYHSNTTNLMYEKQQEYSQTIDEYCQYLVQCTLSKGLKKSCPCGKEISCDQHITQTCSSVIQYPSKGLLTPYLFAYYTNERKWLGKKRPDFYQMMGSIRCRRDHGQVSSDQPIWLNNTVDRTHITLESMFCDNSQTTIQTDKFQFQSLCYENESLTLGKRLSYAFVNVCKRCISQYRINDGIRDCLMGEDEQQQQQQRNTCTKSVRRHRFRCSSGQDTCLLVKSLGDSFKHCDKSNDEFVSGTGQSLSTIVCAHAKDDGCRFLLEYIIASKTNFNGSRQMTTKAQMLFRSYCNTFWNLPDKSDESSETCHHWICGQDEYQCTNNQCIPRTYLCDGEWDCADASDELFHIKNLSYHNKIINLSLKQTECALDRNINAQSFDHFCDVTSEYPCLLVNFTRQLDVFHSRPCIKLSQIGDNTIDCLGGLDERNTWTHCRGVGPLGFAFQCQSKITICIEDQHLCTRDKSMFQSQ